MKNYAVATIAFTCAPIGQLALLAGATTFGQTSANMIDWLLCLIIPFWAWVTILW